MKEQRNQEITLPKGSEKGVSQDWHEDKSGLGGLCHKVATGLSPGFQPWELDHKMTRPERTIEARLSSLVVVDLQFGFSGGSYNLRRRRPFPIPDPNRTQPEKI